MSPENQWSNGWFTKEIVGGSGVSQWLLQVSSAELAKWKDMMDQGISKCPKQQKTCQSPTKKWWNEMCHEEISIEVIKYAKKKKCAMIFFKS